MASEGRALGGGVRRALPDVAGLACYIAWSYVFWNGALLSALPASSPFEAGMLFLTQGVCTALSTLAFALLASRIAPLRRRGALLVCLAGVSVAAVVLAVWGSGAGNPWLSLWGFALSGVGSSLRLAWEERLSVRGAGVTAAYVGASYLAGFVLFACLALLPDALLVVCALALPIVSCLLLVYQGRVDPISEPYELDEGVRAPVSEKGPDLRSHLGMVPWRIPVVVALMYLCYGVARMGGVAGSGDQALPLVATLAAGTPTIACLIGVAVAYVAYRRNALIAFYVAFPLLAAVSIYGAVAGAGQGAPAMFFLANVGAETVKYLMWFLLIDVIVKDGASALVCLGLLRAAQWGGSSLGQVVEGAVPTAAGTSIAILSTLVVALLLVMGTAPLARSEQEPARRRSPHELDERVRLASERYALSPRETEVLAIWATGRSAAYVEKTLFIAQSTVKTHLNHIYAKTGTSNREELIELLAALG